MARLDATNARDTGARERPIVAGLYLAKYDLAGLRELGFESFVEAFNVIGYALGSKAASIKNYRDEFDPLFPNPRKGWHKRGTREYCLAVLEKYNDLDLESFTGLVKSFFGYDENKQSQILQTGQDDCASSFAQRLITGIAAEQYFESIHGNLPEFSGYGIENTTRFGCGYDFRLRREPDRKAFLAIEVKGLRGQTGSLAMTPKEYEAASILRERFFLFVVTNFRKSPSHRVFQDPLSSALHFKKTERVTVQVSWLANV